MRPRAVALLVPALLACDEPTGSASAGTRGLLFEGREPGGARSLYVLPFDGGEPVRLAGALDGDRRPSAGGEVIAFVRDVGGRPTVMVRTADGATRSVAPALAAADLAVSRDGARLAVVAVAEGEHRLWTARINGSELRMHGEAFALDGTLAASPAWAPDGRRLAFVSTAFGSADVMLFSPGDLPEGVAATPAAELDPAWSPDGTRIAFASTRDAGDVELYVADVRSGRARRLTRRAGRDAQPAWVGPDRLVYVAWDGDVPTLRWLDPEREGESHPIATGTLHATHPVAWGHW